MVNQRRLLALFAGMFFISTVCKAMEPENNVETLKEGLKGKVVFLLGYPGSGKGTQGKILQEFLQIPHVSTGELFREEAKSGSVIGKKMAKYMDKGAIIPSKHTFPYLKQEFGKEKYRNGFILDGYPKNKESFEDILETLKHNCLELLVVLHFDIAREEAEKRMLARSVEDTRRSDDKPDIIKNRLDSYEEKTFSLHALYDDMGVLNQIKVPDTREEMTKLVFKTLESAVRRNKLFSQFPRSSYFLKSLSDGMKENSTIFHNHIDAKDQLVLRDIISKIDQRVPSAQNKIYPVYQLILGNQTTDGEFKEVYANLPNFHRIRNAKHEAFSTGKMGEEGINYEQVRITLEVAHEHPKQGVMTEIEEDIYEFSVSDDGNLEIHLDRGNTPYEIDWNQLIGWKEKMISNIPKYELHHGFDIKKKPGETEPPIELFALLNATTESGFSNGGWFIFAKENTWAYRSNEFSNLSYDSCKEMLEKQATDLRGIVKTLLNTNEREFESRASLEKVHAIWRIN